MARTIAFTCPHRGVAFTKFVENHSVAVAMPPPLAGHGIADLLAFHEAVPQDEHAPDDVSLPRGEQCPITVYDATQWRRLYLHLVQIAAADHQIHLSQANMDQHQLTYFAVCAPST